MTNHIWQVFAYELQRNLRRKGFLFTTFGIPILAYILFFGYQFISSRSAGGEDIATTITESEQFQGIEKAGYVDHSGLFTDPGDLRSVLSPYTNEESAQQAMDAGEIDIYYVFPENYLDTGDIVAYMPRFSIAQATESLVQQLVYAHFAQNVDPILMSRLISPAAINEVNLQRDATGETTTNFDVDFPVIYLFVMIMMISQFTTNGYLMQTIIEEKETKLIEILISALRPTQLLIGKILALGVLGLVQIAVWLGAVLLLAQIAGDVGTTLLFLLNISIPTGTVILFLVYFVLGYLFFAAVYGMVGAISNSMQEGPQFAVIFVLPAVIPLYFMTIFITQPDGALATALSLFPITAPLSMVMRLTISTVPAWQVILSIVVLILTNVGMMWLAGRLFRVNTLLSGQTPKLRDIPKLLRG